MSSRVLFFIAGVFAMAGLACSKINPEVRALSSSIPATFSSSVVEITAASVNAESVGGAKLIGSIRHAGGNGLRSTVNNYRLVLSPPEVRP